MEKGNIQNDLDFLFDDEIEATGSIPLDSVSELAKGDYSTHMEELFSDDDNEHHSFNYSDDEVEEQFLYTGKDVKAFVGNYHEQMHDILGPDIDKSTKDEGMTENFSVYGQANSSVVAIQHESSESDHNAQNIESRFTTSVPFETVMSSSASSSSLGPTTIPVVPSYLHPSVSRLRSSVNYTSENYFSNEHYRTTLRRSSRASSVNEFEITETSTSQEVHVDPFRWTRLLFIREYLFPKLPNKAHTILGTPYVGCPSVMAANGLICIGTDRGLVLLFDFQQRFKCICGDENSFTLFGPVTALALSHDHTFIAAGHEYGHIQLFDLSKPSTPARTVNPITLAAVSSGRQEGHLAGSRIVQVGFIGGRNTAIASADDRGLAFYHSLGKMLFIEASDTLRILGKYPEDIKLKDHVVNRPIDIDIFPNISPGHNAKSRPERQRWISSILGMAPLPLGTFPHSTDAYHLIAILTPLKLVVVGLSPSPKTWFRIHREGEDNTRPESDLKGNLAWFPSVALPNGDSDGSMSTNLDRRNFDRTRKKLTVTSPLLAYSWGPSLIILSVFETRTYQKIKNEKNGKMEKMAVGRVNYRPRDKITLEYDIESIQWLNVNQIFVATCNSLYVYDVRDMQVVERTSFDASALVSRTLTSRTTGTQTHLELIGNVSQSFKAYKGKLFLLEYNDLKVGTLLTWADHVLSLVQDENLLSAINLTRLYYLGEAKGNKNGLPENVYEMRQVTGNKLRELMVASTRYIFSEDRLTDATHVTPDNRGVDRTALFEGLVSTCISACLALNDLDFVFEDLFHWYDKYGILGIFMKQMEPFILDDSIHFVPPRITQRLISIHEDNGDLNAAERVIWHIDPECLDVNQAVQICQKYHLYDALVYVYTTALRDYVSPLVEFLQLIRQLQRYWNRTTTSTHLNFRNNSSSQELPIESLMSSAFKVYNYLTHILSGLTYPSGKPLPDDESNQAQKDVYEFLFYGRSSVWPEGNGGRVIFTADEDGDMEPTYPYVRLLLKFDAEAFLHTLDIVLESSYLNDEKQGVNRQIIIKVLLEVTVSATNLTQTDLSFLNIFLARNIPKYPQFIHVTPSILQKILIELASFKIQESLEDRQLAAEHLLSVYTPHDMEGVLLTFRKAGFFRILRSWYQQEGRWALLLQSIFEDPSMDVEDVFLHVTDVLADVKVCYKQHLPEDMIAIIMKNVSFLLHASFSRTAVLINQFIPSHHTEVLSIIGADNRQAQYAYLKCLLGPPTGLTDRERMSPDLTEPSSAVEKPYRLLYIELLCQFEPENSVTSLQYLPIDFVELEEILRICEKEEVYDAVIYKVNESISALESINKVESFSERLSQQISVSLLPDEHVQKKDRIDVAISRLQSVTRMGLSLCLNHSLSSTRVDTVDEQLENMWYKLLRSEIDSAQILSRALVTAAFSTPSTDFSAQQHCLTLMRNLIYESFTGLLSASSSKNVSFPGLFKRLVESTAQSRVDLGPSYTEFRAILTSMLESYRSEGDMLSITKHLIGRNIRETFEILKRERMKGRICYLETCRSCGKAIISNAKEAKSTSKTNGSNFVISPTGENYHTQCLSPNLSTTSVLH